MYFAGITVENQITWYNPLCKQQHPLSELSDEIVMAFPASSSSDRAETSY